MLHKIKLVTSDSRKHMKKKCSALGSKRKGRLWQTKKSTTRLTNTFGCCGQTEAMLTEWLRPVDFI